MAYIEELVKELMHPSEEYSPIPFWFLNDAPDRDKIRNQLADFMEKGVDGIVLHPRIGIPEEIPYLSEEYFEAVRFVVETAAGLGMKIVLYDEGMYPSGSAHGLVVRENPDFASKGIRIADAPSGLETLAKLANGKYLIRDFTGGTIRGIHYGEDDGEKGAPLSADILNPLAVDTFIHLTHDRYYEELGPYFGSTIIAFFTDEPCALGRNAGAFREWADGMREEILAAGGSLEELEGLFTGRENRTTDIYKRLVKKHLQETFYGPLSNWCGQHGIALMGHPAESDDVSELFYFQIPGQDLIMRRVAPKTGGLLEPDSVHAKLSADIGRHLGRRRVMNECFGVCGRGKHPWHFTGEDMKWYIDWLAMRGVNLFVPHAFYYSVEGKRKEERPPDVGPNNIWWPYYRKFSDYIKRLSYLMTDSVNDVAVAVLCDDNRIPCAEVAALYENQIEFHYLSDMLLPKCAVGEGEIGIRDYRYKVVLDVLGLGETYQEYLSEARIVHTAKEVLALCDEEGNGKGDGEGNGTDNTAGKKIFTDRQYKDLRSVCLVKKGTEMYLLSNEGKETLNMRVHFPEMKETVAVDLWNGEYGLFTERKPAGQTSYKESFQGFPITLNPCETLLMISGKTEETAAGKMTALREDSVPDWTERFCLQSKEGNKAIYRYEYEAASQEKGVVFQIQGEEMAECFCNGELAGVSFWNPHRFAIGACLRPGKNVIELQFTGSAANLYEEADIPYGIR